MGSNDLPPYAPTTPKGKPDPIITGQRPSDPPPHTGTPATGAGSRRTHCARASSWADEEGSADGGADDGSGGVDAGGSGGAEVTGGDGWTFVGTGSPGCELFPGRADADGSPPSPDGDAEADADFPGRAFPPCSCFPSPGPPYPEPPPPPPGAPSGASPPRCPAECAGRARPSSSPTLTHPAATDTASAVTARRTGTYKRRTAATSEGGKGSQPPQLPPPARGHAPPPNPRPLTRNRARAAGRRRCRNGARSHAPP